MLLTQRVGEDLCTVTFAYIGREMTVSMMD